MLEAGLLLETGERAAADAGDGEVAFGGGEGGERVDPGGGQLAGLVAAEAGHPAEVVVVLAPALAGLVPAAHAAVADGQRVGDRLVGQRGEEAGPHGAVVGGHLGGADRGPVLAAEDHVHVLGLGALEAGDLLGVEAELQDGRRLHLAGQLGVLGLVAPGPEAAGAIDLAEEVGVTPPQHVVPLVEEGGLEDDVGAVSHGLRCLGLSLAEGVEAIGAGGGLGDLDDVEALGLEASAR